MKNTIYKRTTISCFVGIFTQAIMTNLIAILFIPLMTLYGFNYAQLGLLVAINFIAQVSADILFSGLIDKIGYRKMVLPTTVCSFVGLLMLGFTPFFFPNNIFTGLIIATIIASFSSGLLEILLSPIISAIPNNDKGPAMSLMHSFYAWGQVLTIAITSLSIFIFGYNNWRYICFFWALVPLINYFMFYASKFPKIIADHKRQNFKDLILKPFYLLSLGAISFGACGEIIMNQWCSVFMENGLGFDKITGDLIGMCGYAIMMGLGRTLYGVFGAKLKLHKALILMSLCTAICYVVAALSPFNFISMLACILCGFMSSLLWPGTIVVASLKYPLAGAWMFAILAAAGDIGASYGPWLTGTIVENSLSSPISESLAFFLSVNQEQASIRIGLLFAGMFPIFAMICHIAMNKLKDKKDI